MQVHLVDKIESGLSTKRLKVKAQMFVHLCMNFNMYTYLFLHCQYYDFAYKRHLWSGPFGDAFTSRVQLYLLF